MPTDSATVLSADGTRIAYRETGDRGAPTVVLLHGYPDTSRIWDEVAGRLAGRFHVVAYDVRGAGASGAPHGVEGYSLARLEEDFFAVADAVSPDRGVHLVGHDWGSIQGWEPVTSPGASSRIASYTSMSGPCLDHVGHWRRERRTWRPRAVRQLVRQALRSWYVGFFQVPVLPGLLWRVTRGRRFGPTLRRFEGIEPRPGHPARTLAGDGARGVKLYRANVRERLRHPRERHTDVPVQVIVATRDPWVTPSLFQGLDRWVSRLWIRSVAARHWLPRSRPELVARWVGELVDHAEGGPEAPALRRVRVSSDRRPFDDHLVVVTGAGSGIGRATALAFAEQGAAVVAADLDPATAERTAALAGSLGPAAHAYGVDVSDAEAMESFAKAVEHEHGVPDVVVNNAGVGVAGPFLDTSVEEWERVFDVNVWGVIHGSRLFGRQMVERGDGGHIVNLASAAAFVPSRTLPAYATSKAAALMLTECLRAELADEGVGVTAICPGVIDTAIASTTRFVGVTSDEADEQRRAAVRLYTRRGFTPDRVADEILRAVRADAAVVAVAPEAKVLQAIGRFTPKLARALARRNASPGGQR